MQTQNKYLGLRMPFKLWRELADEAKAKGIGTSEHIRRCLAARNVKKR